MPASKGCRCKASLNFRALFSSLGTTWFGSGDQNQLAIYMATESGNALSMSLCDGSKTCQSEGLSYPMLGDLRDLDFKIARFDEMGPTAIWINNSLQNLQMSNNLGVSPDPTFPFSRIATISSNTSEEISVLVYHQITEFVLVEDIWQRANRVWVKNNITIQLCKRDLITLQSSRPATIGNVESGSNKTSLLIYTL